MNTEEHNSRQGKLNTPTQEAELVVELNFDIVKTIQSLPADLQSFRDDNLNERKKQQAINEALLRNMTGGILQGKPTHSINRFNKEFYHKWASIPWEEGKEEHTSEPLEGDYHTISSDDSFSPSRNKLRNDGNLQGEFQKIKSPTYEGEMNTGEKAEERLLGMRK